MIKTTTITISQLLMMRYWTNFWMNNTNNNINNSINLINDNNIYNNNNSSAQSNFVQYFWIFESTAKIRTSRKQTMTIYTKRLGLQCWTPLRSYPLTLIPYPLTLSLVPYPQVLLLPRKFRWGSCCSGWWPSFGWVDHPRNGRWPSIAVVTWY